jgi:hypothetical protein
MGIEFVEAVYAGAQLGRINVFYHMGLLRQVRTPRGALRPQARRDQRCNPKLPLGELFCPGNLVNQNAGAGRNLAKAHYRKAGHEFF